MQILFLISQLPFPADTGAKIRSYNLIKKASREHTIDLVTFGNTVSEAEKIKELKQYCRHIFVFDRVEQPRELAVLLNFFSPLPFNVQKYYSRTLSRFIEEQVKKENYDVIHCDSLQVSCNVQGHRGIPKVLTEHNIEAQIIKRYRDNESNIFKKWIIHLQWKKLLNYEIEICQRFEACSTVSDEDREFLRANTGLENIGLVPNGVDCELFTPQGNNPEPKTLIFTGSLDWLPNEDGLCYFFKDIYPLLKKNCPQVKICVVGRNPGKVLADIAAKDLSVHLAGRVDDVRPFMKKAQVFVVPLRIGGGTRLKILEAMACGIPVVSTKVGAEGLAVKNRENIMLADDPAEFTECILRLFDDQPLRNEIIRQGRNVVESKYSWDIIVKELVKLWQQAAGKLNEK